LFGQENTNHTPNPDPSRFKEAVEIFNRFDLKNSFPKDAILFVGSSSIRLWESAVNFPGYPVINRGFGGSHISDVIYYIEPLVIKYNPWMIVLYAGDNDIAAAKKAEQVFGDYKKFVNLVKKELPNAKIIFLPIKPSLDRWKFWDEIKEANGMIRIFTEKDKSLYYVDTATPMLGSEALPDSSLFVEDGLHLNSKGYELWTEILIPVLEKIYNKKK